MYQGMLNEVEKVSVRLVEVGVRALYVHRPTTHGRKKISVVYFALTLPNHPRRNTDFFSRSVNIHD